MPMSRPEALEAFVERGRGEEQPNPTFKRKRKKQEAERKEGERMERRVVVLLPENLHKDFSDICEKNGEKLSTCLRRLAAKYVNNGGL